MQQAPILAVASFAALIFYQLRNRKGYQPIQGCVGQQLPKTIDERVSLLQHQYKNYIQTARPDTERSEDFFDSKIESKNRILEKPVLLILLSQAEDSNQVSFFDPRYLKKTYKEKLVTATQHPTQIEPFILLIDPIAENVMDTEKNRERLQQIENFLFDKFTQSTNLEPWTGLQGPRSEKLNLKR
jgi:hypothetical protein